VIPIPRPLERLSRVQYRILTTSQIAACCKYYTAHMVDMIFHIKGKPDEIFGVGFRPAIMGKAAEVGLKSAATNVRDEKNPKVQVLVSGSSDTITRFHREIKNNDIRIMTVKKPTYTVTDPEGYVGPNIDWEGYQLSMMTEQMLKGFTQANETLSEMSRQISKGFAETNNQLTTGFKSLTYLLSLPSVPMDGDYRSSSHQFHKHSKYAINFEFRNGEVNHKNNNNNQYVC
jgi:acylphosphatase